MKPAVISNFFKPILTALLITVGLSCFAESGGVETIEKTVKGPVCGPQNVFATGKSYFVDDVQRLTGGFIDHSATAMVSLRVRDDVRFDFSFTYNLNLSVNYYNIDGVNVGSDNLTLTVEYKQGHVSYKGLDTKRFPGNIHRLEATVTGTSVTGATPADNMLELGLYLIIDRRFTNANFSTAAISPTFTELPAKKAYNVTWTPVVGANEYDVEWTTIDKGADYYSVLKSAQTNASPAPSPAIVTQALENAFRNNATRITVDAELYEIPAFSTDELLLVRIRAVRYQTLKVREYSGWTYTKNPGGYNIFALNWNEPNLNWQYSASYAEEGKKKEVVSYFDGTLRNRQTVTINNSDNVAIAQENIYDAYGRPAASVLPAPVYQSTPVIQYIPGLLINTTTGQPYNATDLFKTSGTNCEFTPEKLNTIAGASRYYSPNNNFLTLNSSHPLNKNFNKFIPDAEGYPLAVTQYTLDNTGRVRLQGGVGEQFQPGKGNSTEGSKTTKYFYGKPDQTELDELFGNDVGLADHYTKNMVIDPNGQISVSYLNASGKTIATALSGAKPANVDALSSYPVNVQPSVTHVLRPEQFTFNSTTLKLTAHTTYLAPYIDLGAKITFDIPQVTAQYTGPGNFSFCRSCYYDMTVSVVNDCGTEVGKTTTPITVGLESGLCTSLTNLNPVVNCLIDKPGAYEVIVEIRYKPEVITRFTDSYIEEGINASKIESQFKFIKQRYLDNINASGCYSDCHTCTIALGSTPDNFVAEVKATLTKMGLDVNANLTEVNTWVNGLYTQLKTQCQSLQGGCSYNPCAGVEQAMLADVSPGGQYALFSEDLQPLETYNIIADHFAEAFSSAHHTFTDDDKVTLPNGIVVSPADGGMTLKDVVTYWKPSWALLFLEFHPEACKLKFCNAISNFKDWDLRLQNEIGKADDLALVDPALSWNPANSESWLLNADPYFNGTGKGATYKSAMLADLQHYSANVLNLPVNSQNPEKGLIAYTDFAIYCADKVTPGSSTWWANCTVNSSCRVKDREWTTYLNYYLQLKEKYYEQLRATQPYCGTGGCIVGPQTSYSLTTSDCPQTTEFAIEYRSTDPVTGEQQMVLNHIGGPVKKNVGVGLYYVNVVDNTTGSLPHNIFLSLGEQSKSFTLPSTVDLSKLRISGVNCDGGPFPTNWGTFVLQGTATITEEDVEQTLTETDGCSRPVYSNNRRLHVTLTDSGSPINAGPGGVTIDVGYIVNYAGQTPMAETITVQVAENQSEGYSSVFEHSREGDCMPYITFSRNADCIQSVSGIAEVKWIYGYCGGVPPNTTPPACSPILAYKKSRFEKVTGSFPQTAPDVTALQAQAADDIDKIRHVQAEGIAQGWLIALDEGLKALNPSIQEGHQKRTDLLDALTTITYHATNDAHPRGAVDDPTSNPAYINYKAAIKSIIFNNSGPFTTGVNPWLLSSPGRYATPQQMAPSTIDKTSTAICALLAPLKTAANNAGQTLYNYLVSAYPNAMTLSQEETKAIEDSCPSCFILPSAITLPAFLDPNTPAAISRSTYNTTKAQLAAEFGNTLSDQDEAYPTILTNYLNQEFGFMLSYTDYLDYEAASSPTGPTPNLKLVNSPPYKTIGAPRPMDCLNALLEQAISSGKAGYDDYIADLRQKYREAYIATCQLSRPAGDMQVKQATYHYTLYYYDQADNLVRTVPPEGVHPLAGAELLQVNLNRQYKNANGSCTYSGPVSQNKPAALQTLGTILQSTGTVAIEAWLYNDGTKIDHIAEVSGDKKWLYQLTINGSKVGLDIYPMTEAANQRSVVLNAKSRHYQAAIPAAMLPLTAWTHTVVQGISGLSGNTMPQIYINGASLSVSASNQLQPVNKSGFKIQATANGVVYPDDMPTLKHWRFYTRTLSASEILANAQSSCLMPQSQNLLTWYRFNIPAPGTPTTISPNSTDETTIKEIYPNHTLLTSYAYNATNQVTHQSSPDGGESNFWYDTKSRLVLSQNARQKDITSYSYTLYDDFSRITEVGQKGVGSNLAIAPVNGNTQPAYNDSPISGGANTEITKTFYDQPAASLTDAAIATEQTNLYKRVAATMYFATDGGPVVNATYYKYDIAGNVNTLWQKIDGLGTKRIDYEYDLASGKVNFLRYQHGQKDQFYYEYKYDAENRLTEAWSGVAAIIGMYTNNGTLLPELKRLDASYQYYLHGPLARMELGDQYGKVQGLDYAYTLQGWLKGVNGQTLTNDMGGDGPSATNLGKDAYAYSLGYFNGDYKPINGTSKFNFNYAAQGTDATGRYLYNGNISNSTLAVSTISSGTPLGFTYGYDQLNRLTKASRHDITSVWNSTASSKKPDHEETFTYDGNGNILNATRNAVGSTQVDNLTYSYNCDALTTYLTNNRLRHVTDAGNSGATDLQSQGTDNYVYDAIGNLVQDNQAGNLFGWSVYGKINEIRKGTLWNTATVATKYGYDASGNRVTKASTTGGVTTTTFYVRDTQGNPIAVYDNTGGVIGWKEQHLYGSSRLGMWRPAIADLNGSVSGLDVWQYYGNRQYELNNHLGNVIATITDRRIQIPEPGTAFHLEADVSTAQTYYAFGAAMPGLQYNAAAGQSNYRYSFNGKEDDTDIEAGAQDYGMRIYDKRVARFLSVDPITAKYPELTPYQFASNSPIENIDLDGLEGVPAKLHPDGNISAAKASTFIPSPTLIIKKDYVYDPEILVPDIYGVAQIGRQSYILPKVAAIRQEYQNAVADNIKGGVFGTLGYYIGGERGSFVGAIGDGVSMSVSGYSPQFLRATPKIPTYNKITTPVFEVEAKPFEAPIDIVIQLRKNWDTEQINAAYLKARAITNNPNTKVTLKNPAPRPANLKRLFLKAGGVLQPGQHVDHLIDLQLNGNNGADGRTNLWGLNGSVNTSFGSQIYQQIKSVPDNTRVNRVLINPFPIPK